MLLRTFVRWTAVLLFCVVLPGGPLAAESKFVGVRKCGTCHKKELIGKQQAVWREGPHAKAYATLANEESRLIAERVGIRGPASESQACLSCHATAFGLSKEQLRFELALKDGVQCESCHGPGSRYRKKKYMSDIDKARARGLWDAAKPEICTACHNERSPTFDPMRYSLPGGGHSAFDHEQAVRVIAHPIPEHVKGHYVELEEEQKKAKKRAAEGLQ